MFDLSLFANPARLKREFLASSDVATQTMGDELQIEFDRMRELNADVRLSGQFWSDFFVTYRRQVTALILGRSVSTLMILAAVLASQKILDASNTVNASVWLLVCFALLQFSQQIVNAWTSLLQSQLLVCIRTFVTLRMNTKLLRMGELSSNEFSMGNLKTLISSDIYRVNDFLLSAFRNGMPCLLGLLILGPAIWIYMGVPGLVALIVAFGALPLSFLLGKYVYQKERLIKAEEDDLSTIIGEWVTNVRLLRFLCWENLMRARVARHVRMLVTQATRQHGVNLINFGVSVGWWLLPIIALIYTSEALGQENDIPTVFASIWMLNHITLYIRWLPGIFINYSASSACVSRLNTLFSHRNI